MRLWHLLNNSIVGQAGLEMTGQLDKEFYFILWVSVPFSFSVMSNSLWPHGLQHTRLHCPSISPRVCSNSCPLSWWYYLTISSSVTPFSFCLQSFPAVESFPRSWLSALGGQSVRASASASVLPVNIQGWFLLWLTSLISLQSKGLSRFFSILQYKIKC